MIYNPWNLNVFGLIAVGVMVWVLWVGWNGLRHARLLWRARGRRIRQRPGFSVIPPRGHDR